MRFWPPAPCFQRLTNPPTAVYVPKRSNSRTAGACLKKFSAVIQCSCGHAQQDFQAQKETRNTHMSQFRPKGDRFHSLGSPSDPGVAKFVAGAGQLILQKATDDGEAEPHLQGQIDHRNGDGAIRDLGAKSKVSIPVCPRPEALDHAGEGRIAPADSFRARGRAGSDGIRKRPRPQVGRTLKFGRPSGQQTVGT